MKLHSDRYYLLRMVGDRLDAVPRLFFVWRLTPKKAVGAWVSTRWEDVGGGVQPRMQIVPDWGDEVELLKSELRSVFPVTLEMLADSLAAMENDKRIAAAKPGENIEAAGNSDVCRDPSRLTRRSPGKPPTKKAETTTQSDGEVTMNTLMIPQERQVWDWCCAAAIEQDNGDRVGSVAVLLTTPELVEKSRPEPGWRAFLRCLQNKGLLSSTASLLEYSTDDYVVPASAIRAVTGTDALLSHAESIVAAPAPAAPAMVATPAQAGESRSGKKPRAKAEPVEFLNHQHCGVEGRVFIRAAYSIGYTKEGIFEYLRRNGPAPSMRWISNEVWKLNAGKVKVPEGVDLDAIRAALEPIKP